jgi:hypothetical protein
VPAFPDDGECANDCGPAHTSGTHGTVLCTCCTYSVVIHLSTLLSDCVYTAVKLLLHRCHTVVVYSLCRCRPNVEAFLAVHGYDVLLHLLSLPGTPTMLLLLLLLLLLLCCYYHFCYYYNYCQLPLLLLGEWRVSREMLDLILDMVHTHICNTITVITLLLHCCYTVVARLLHCCYTVVTLLSYSVLS